MAKYTDLELYNLVRTAREQTAGDNVQPKSTVTQSLTTAIEYAVHHSVPTEIIEKLKQCREKIGEAKRLNDRLRIDDILCGMLKMEIGE